MSSNNSRPSSSEAANALALLTRAIENQQQQQTLSSQSTQEILRALGLLPPTSIPSNSNTTLPTIPSPLRNHLTGHNSSSKQQQRPPQPQPTRSGRIPQLPSTTTQSISNYTSSTTSNKDKGKSASTTNRDTLLFNEYFDYNDYNSSDDDEEDLDFNPFSFAVDSNYNDFTSPNQFSGHWAGEEGESWGGDTPLTNGTGGGSEGGAGRKRRKRLRRDGDFSSGSEESEEDESDEDETGTDFSNFDEPFIPSTSGLTDDGMIGGGSDQDGNGGNTTSSFYSGIDMDIDILDNEEQTPYFPVASTSNLNSLPLTINPSATTSNSTSNSPPPLSTLPPITTTTVKSKKKTPKSTTTSSTVKEAEMPEVGIVKKPRKPYAKRVKKVDPPTPEASIQVHTPAPPAPPPLSLPLPPPAPILVPPIVSRLEGSLGVVAGEVVEKKPRKPYKARALIPRTEEYLQQIELGKERASLKFYNKKKKKNDLKLPTEGGGGGGERGGLEKRLLFENNEMRKRIKELGGGDWICPPSLTFSNPSQFDQNGNRAGGGGGGDSNASSWSSESNEGGGAGTGAGGSRNGYDDALEEIDPSQQRQEDNDINNLRIDGKGPSTSTGRNQLNGNNTGRVEGGGKGGIDLVRFLEWAKEAGNHSNTSGHDDGGGGGAL